MSNLLLHSDNYKIGHHNQYPPGTEKVYSYCCSRSSRVPNVNEVVFFGLQYYIKAYLMKPITYGNKDTFIRRVKYILGPDAVTPKLLKDIDQLIEWGYLPLRIKALPEGSRVPLGVAQFTIENTHPDFYWLTNFVETLLSKIWFTSTAATTASLVRELCDKYADFTCDNREHVKWQVHDFSARGQSSVESAGLAGAAHLLSFEGSDTMDGSCLLEDYYGELAGGSVAATEHSVQCLNAFVNSNGSHSKDELIQAEIKTLSRLLDVYPKGILSVVADSFHYWDYLTIVLPSLKDKILARDGKLVVRPDTSEKTPLEVICGDPEYWGSGNDRKAMGSLRLLWDTFGGTINSKGYHILNSHIGLIYGEAITLDLLSKIFTRMEKMGFASSNLVTGIGSFAYTYVTRDTYGYALKATFGEVGGKEYEIFKDPIDDKKKKSAYGKVAVYKGDLGKGFFMIDGATDHQESNNELKTVFENGKLLVEWTTSQVRSNLYN
jgi:nicotinamide phosphoribosyltransferase